MLPKAHLTSHSRMSGSRWVITPSRLSGSWRKVRTFRNIITKYKYIFFTLTWVTDTFYNYLFHSPLKTCASVLSKYLYFPVFHCLHMFSWVDSPALPSFSSSFLEGKSHFCLAYSAGFPGGTSGKEPTCQYRRHKRGGFDPFGSGRSPWGEHGDPLQYSCLENPMDRGAWRAGLKKVGHDWGVLAENSVLCIVLY